MPGGMEQRHVTKGAILLESALGFTAFSTPKEPSSHHLPADPWALHVPPPDTPLATHLRAGTLLPPRVTSAHHGRVDVVAVL